MVIIGAPLLSRPPASDYTATNLKNSKRLIGSLITYSLKWLAELFGVLDYSGNRVGMNQTSHRSSKKWCYSNMNCWPYLESSVDWLGAQYRASTVWMEWRLTSIKLRTHSIDQTHSHEALTAVPLPYCSVPTALHWYCIVLWQTQWSENVVSQHCTWLCIVSDMTSNMTFYSWMYSTARWHLKQKF